MAWTDNIFRWLGFGRYNSTLPTVSDAQVEELQVDSRGRLRVAIDSVASSLKGIYQVTPGAVADGAVVDLLADSVGRLRVFIDRSVDEPGRSIAAVTLDSDFSPAGRFLWVGAAGNVELVAVDGGSAQVLVGVPAATLLRIQVKRVNSAGTTVASPTTNLKLIR
jgi:hypothetical protein